ncbi:hypothetical protein LJC60_00975 [Ruminococcaceae bacterium OttesenSCG-928-D13]|nr:hypothetical protein [Ruminococcaceae bacterium OttesenSCG-928-D13]
MTETKIDGSVGIRIKTVGGIVMDFSGLVSYIDWPEDGRVYYCAGHSFMAEIVTNVFGAEKKATRC